MMSPEYHPLRKVFWDIPQKIINSKIEKILVTFGGADITNETPGILKFLTSKYPSLEKHIIIGKSFSNVEMIQDVSDEKTYLFFEPDSKTIINEMLECDMAITASGQTIYELARIGITTFGKQIADNQYKNYISWREKGFLLGYDLLETIPGEEKRKELCGIGRSIVDGRGALRIAEILLK